MKIKVEIEVDGTLLERLESASPTISSDSISIISNMARVDAREIAQAHVIALTEARERKEAARLAKIAKAKAKAKAKA